MAYLIYPDFLPHIQKVQLEQLQSNDAVLSSIIENAESECRSHLVQKYDIDFEMRDLVVWDISRTYYAGDRIYLDATPYDPTKGYSPNESTLYNGNVYICGSEGATGTFDPTKWTLYGAQYSMWTGKYPNPLFSLYGYYGVGDIVYYNGHNWKALQASIVPYPDIQYVTYANIPYPNVYPTTANPTYWQDMGAYTIAAGTSPGDGSKWDIGDTREVQLKGYMLDIALYHIHQRLAPTNIPMLREVRYMGKETDRSMLKGRLYFPEYSALGWLQGCAEGRLTPALPLIQPKQGRRISWGGNIKAQNDY
jgi:hypothetical protein